MKYKLNMTPNQVIERAVDAVKYASKYTQNIEFSAEDASRSDLEFLYLIFEKVIQAGATVINVPDTVGYAIPPKNLVLLLKKIKENTKGIDKVELSVHCHNDLGMATANTVAAVINGADQVEVAVNGIGERAGNSALEEVIMTFVTRKDFFKDIIVTQDTSQIIKLSTMVSNFTGMPVQPNKAIVGKNAFAHESGIHQDGLIKERTTYEIMDAKSIGLKNNSLVLGKHSGRHAFKEYLNASGYKVDEDTFENCLTNLRILQTKKRIYQTPI